MTAPCSEDVRINQATSVTTVDLHPIDRVDDPVCAFELVELGLNVLGDLGPFYGRIGHVHVNRALPDGLYRFPHQRLLFDVVV